MTKYQVISCDPPWYYAPRDKSKKFGFGASNHYQLMKHAELLKMEGFINSLAANPSALFIWTTGPKLPEACELIKAWGYRYATIAFTWLKKYHNGTDVKNPGNYTASNVELCLLGVKGSMRPKQKLVPQTEHSEFNYPDLESVEEHVRLKHSEKPEIFRQRIEAMFDGPYMEIFARKTAPNWDCRGLEVDGRPLPLEVEIDPLKPVKLLANKARCRKCQDVIESKYTHDYKNCKCGAIMVDGGLDYCRRGGNAEDLEDLSVWGNK